LIGPYCDALRSAGLKVGLYFSHLDWSHPDYASVLKTGMEHVPDNQRNAFSYPLQVEEDPARWQKFIGFSPRPVKRIIASIQA
jgi:alpha-L-fucosidase